MPLRPHPFSRPPPPLPHNVPTNQFQVQPVGQLVRDTAGVMQEYTQRGGVRPFGVSLLVAGYDDDGPQLFQVHVVFYGGPEGWGS